MRRSEKALKNGWGWVLGVSGEECRVYSDSALRPEPDPNELLDLAAKLLGVNDSALVPTRIRRLQEERKKALDSAATAWGAVHNLTRPDASRAVRD